MKRFIGACKGCKALSRAEGHTNLCYDVLADRFLAAVMGNPKTEWDELPSSCPRVLEHTVLGQTEGLLQSLPEITGNEKTEAGLPAATGQQMALSGKEEAQ